MKIPGSQIYIVIGTIKFILKICLTVHETGFEFDSPPGTRTKAWYPKSKKSIRVVSLRQIFLNGYG